MINKLIVIPENTNHQLWKWIGDLLICSYDFVNNEDEIINFINSNIKYWHNNIHDKLEFYQTPLKDLLIYKIVFNFTYNDDDYIKSNILVVDYNIESSYIKL